MNERLSCRCYSRKVEDNFFVLPQCWKHFVELRKRAELFGDVIPEHFIFARFKPVGRFDGKELQEMRVAGFDPTQPLGSWKKAWRALTSKQDCRDCAFTIYAIT